MRISPHVMGRKRLRPLSTLGVVKDRVQHSLQKLRIVLQIQRRRRISYIHRPDGAVAEILLRQEEYLPFLILNQFMGSNRLAVREDTKSRVVFPTCIQSRLVYAAVKFIATIHDLAILSLRSLQRRIKGDFSILCP